MEGCDIVWVIKDESIASTFVDKGAAQFFLPHLNEEKKEPSATVKRLKYSLDEGESFILFISLLRKHTRNESFSESVKL